MKTQNKAKLFHMTYYVNDITGEIIGGNEYGYHEETYSYLRKKVREEHPKEYAAFQRYCDKIRKEKHEYLDIDDFLVRVLGWSYVNLGDYKYHQAEGYIQTASTKPYSLFWRYVKRKDTHLERHPALVYVKESDSICEVARDVISSEELKKHTENLRYYEWNDISDWYDDKPITRTARMHKLEELRQEAFEEERDLERYYGSEYLEEYLSRKERAYWADLLGEGINIYLLNDGAESRGYAQYLEDTLGINVIVGEWRDEKLLLKGAFNDFDLLIFDRTETAALDIANRLAQVCDKSKIIVPVDSFSFNVLSHYLQKGDDEKKAHAQETFELLSNITRFDYGEINNFPQELVKYISNRLSLEIKPTEYQSQRVEAPDKYSLREAIRNIADELDWRFDDDEQIDVEELRYMLQEVYGSFKEMADSLVEPVERLRELSIDNRAFFKLWHEVAQIREAALRGVKIELIMTDQQLDLSLQDMDIESFRLLLSPTVVVGEHDSSLDKGEVLSSGAASGMIKTEITSLNEGDILVCENLFESQDAINKVGGIIARHGNFLDHAAILASMRNIPVIISDNEFLFSGENITIDGETGRIYKGKLPIIGGISKEELTKLINQLSSEDTFKVYANADTAYEVDMAITNFADGIGLVRVENMISQNVEDFYRIAMAAKGKEVTFRITKPIRSNQIESIIIGSQQAGIQPRILIPQVESINEIELVRQLAPNVQVGSMIESIAATNNAYIIAKASDFIAFGTNDITADFYGVKRDSSQDCDNKYFISISDDVFEIMKNTVSEIHAAKANIEIGVCGRHADDIASINKFLEIGINYISGSPSQIPLLKFGVGKHKLDVNYEAAKKLKKSNKN